MSKVRNLMGKKFGRLTVFERDESTKLGRAKWKCICDCKNVVSVVSGDLTGGKTLSCGCYHINSVKKPDGTAAFNAMYNSYRGRALRKNIEFELIKKDFREVIEMNCFYCGAEPSRKFKKRKDVYMCNGIDRINNDKGYTKDNIVPCCPTCNYAKRKMSQEDFLLWAQKLYENFVLERINNKGEEL